MKDYKSENIRNIALIGHGGSGKTTFLEAALFETGVTKKLGKVESGNTVSDYDKMEIEKGFSINTTIVPIEWDGKRINFIDTPGYFDYVGEVNAAMRACEAAAIVVDAGSGVQVGTEQAWKICEKYSMPRFFLINKRDRDEFDFDTTLDALRDKFGSKLVPMSWPIGDDIDDELMEAIAETDEELMEKYFEGEEFTPEEINAGIVNGISSGEIVPVCTTIFQMGQKVAGILDLLAGLTPSPLAHAPYAGKDAAGEDVERACDPAGPAAAFVFKTIVDPFVGKISLMKVVSGKLTSGQDLYNERAGKTERLSKLFILRGKEQIEVPAAEAGDICAVAKLQYTQSGDTLADKDNMITFAPVDYPSPTYYIAIEAEDKNDEEKMGTGLGRLRDEDPSFIIERNAETHQTLLGGQGDMQLNIALAKLKDRFGVSVKTIPQKIAEESDLVDMSEDEMSGGSSIVSGPLFTAPDAKVLIVDDNDINRVLEAMLLKETEVQTNQVSGGVEMLEELTRNSYDVVLLDHIMPDMDGVEALKRAKQIERVKNTGTSFIAITANALSGARDEYIRQGFDDFVSKPINGRRLEEAVMKRLDKSLIKENRG